MKRKPLYRTVPCGFYLVLVVILSVKCTNLQPDIQQNKELLEEFIGTLSDDNHPIFHQTMTQKRVSRYLGEGFSLGNIFFISETPDSLDNYFNDEIIANLTENFKDYKELTITEELAQGHRVVKEDEIPEFVKDKSIPPPFNYSGFTNVLFVSTPVISNNRAVMFLDTYGSPFIGISVYFYVRNNRNSAWKMVGGGIVQEISL